jgi:glycine/D-amino acid oxidase-like deaminating enzyme
LIYHYGYINRGVLSNILKADPPARSGEKKSYGHFADKLEESLCRFEFNEGGGSSASVRTSDGYEVSAAAVVVATNTPINDLVVEEIVYRWSGQVMETIDGLAFTGRNPLDAENVFIATGDSGMGMTHALTLLRQWKIFTRQIEPS